MKFFKKKQYSGNSVIRKYEIKTHLGFFLEGWSNKFWFYTQGYKWIKHLTKYINPFSFNNHEFNFLMLVDDESLMFKDLGVFFSIYVHKSISSLLINGWTFNVFIWEAVEKQRDIVSLADDWESIILQYFKFWKFLFFF